MKGKLKYRTNFLDQQQYLCEKIQNAAQQKHQCHRKEQASYDVSQLLFSSVAICLYVILLRPNLDPQAREQTHYHGLMTIHAQMSF